MRHVFHVFSDISTGAPQICPPKFPPRENTDRYVDENNFLENLEGSRLLDFFVKKKRLV